MSTTICTAVVLASDAFERAETMAVAGFLAGYPPWPASTGIASRKTLSSATTPWPPCWRSTVCEFPRLWADVEDLDFERGHRTLKIVRKGGKRAIIPLAPRTSRPLPQRTDPRTDLLLGQGRAGGPLRRRPHRQAPGPAGRHQQAHQPAQLASLLITAGLDAGVPLRDVQEAASHADPRTTMRYDRGGGSRDRRATYIVATYIVATFLAAPPGRDEQTPMSCVALVGRTARGHRAWESARLEVTTESLSNDVRGSGLLGGCSLS